MSHDVVTFGRYRGRSTLEMLDDKPYITYLALQSWVEEQYPECYRAIRQRLREVGVPEGTPTPAHNKLQSFFLDLGFCRRFLKHLAPSEEVAEDIHPVFEENNVDVTLRHGDKRTSIEVKSGMGDDYPEVLRKIQGQRRQIPDFGTPVLFLKRFQSKVISAEQMRTIFENSSIKVVFTIELEDTQITQDAMPTSLSTQTSNVTGTAVCSTQTEPADPPNSPTQSVSSPEGKRSIPDPALAQVLRTQFLSKVASLGVSDGLENQWVVRVDHYPAKRRSQPYYIWGKQKTFKSEKSALAFVRASLSKL